MSEKVPEKKKRRLLVKAAILLLLVVAVALMAVSTVETWIKPVIGYIAQRQTGLDLRIRSLRLWPLEEIRIRGLSIAESELASPFFSVEDLQIEHPQGISLRSPLKAQREILLRGLQIDLPALQKATAHLAKETPKEKSGALPDLESVIRQFMPNTFAAVDATIKLAPGQTIRIDRLQIEKKLHQEKTTIAFRTSLKALPAHLEKHIPPKSNFALALDIGSDVIRLRSFEVDMPDGVSMNAETLLNNMGVQVSHLSVPVNIPPITPGTINAAVGYAADATTSLTLALQNWKLPHYSPMPDITLSTATLATRLTAQLPGKASSHAFLENTATVRAARISMYQDYFTSATLDSSLRITSASKRISIATDLRFSAQRPSEPFPGRATLDVDAIHEWTNTPPRLDSSIRGRAAYAPRDQQSIVLPFHIEAHAEDFAGTTPSSATVQLDASLLDTPLHARVRTDKDLRPMSTDVHLGPFSIESLAAILQPLENPPDIDGSAAFDLNATWDREAETILNIEMRDAVLKRTDGTPLTSRPITLAVQAQGPLNLQAPTRNISQWRARLESPSGLSVLITTPTLAKTARDYHALFTSVTIQNLSELLDLYALPLPLQANGKTRVRGRIAARTAKPANIKTDTLITFEGLEARDTSGTLQITNLNGELPLQTSIVLDDAQTRIDFDLAQTLLTARRLSMSGIDWDFFETELAAIGNMRMTNDNALILDLQATTLTLPAMLETSGSMLLTLKDQLGLHTTQRIHLMDAGMLLWTLGLYDGDLAPEIWLDSFVASLKGNELEVSTPVRISMDSGRYENLATWGTLDLRGDANLQANLQTLQMRPSGQGTLAIDNVRASSGIDSNLRAHWQVDGYRVNWRLTSFTLFDGQTSATGSVRLLPWPPTLECIGEINNANLTSATTQIDTRDVELEGLVDVRFSLGWTLSGIPEFQATVSDTGETVYVDYESVSWILEQMRTEELGLLKWVTPMHTLEKRYGLEPMVPFRELQAEAEYDRGEILCTIELENREFDITLEPTIPVSVVFDFLELKSTTEAVPYDEW